MQLDRFEFIYEDCSGVLHFDRYFEYIKKCRNKMPSVLWDFASDSARYTLGGESTLHDARLKSLCICNESTVGEEIFVSTDVAICLTLAGGGDLEIVYGDVSSVVYEKPMHHWLNKPIDLLAHEFAVVDGGYRHRIEFDRGAKFQVVFTDFTHKGHNPHIRP